MDKESTVDIIIKRINAIAIIVTMFVAISNLFLACNIKNQQRTDQKNALINSIKILRRQIVNTHITGLIAMEVDMSINENYFKYILIPNIDILKSVIESDIFNTQIETDSYSKIIEDFENLRNLITWYNEPIKKTLEKGSLSIDYDLKKQKNKLSIINNTCKHFLDITEQIINDEKLKINVNKSVYIDEDKLTLISKDSPYYGKKEIYYDEKENMLLIRPSVK